jgi:hypothetical protein
MRANVFVFAGAPDQESGGETSWPSHVYRDGIDPPGWNTEDVSFSVIALFTDAE